MKRLKQHVQYYTTPTKQQYIDIIIVIHLNKLINYIILRWAVITGLGIFDKSNYISGTLKFEVS